MTEFLKKPDESHQLCRSHPRTYEGGAHDVGIITYILYAFIYPYLLVWRKSLS